MAHRLGALLRAAFLMFLLLLTTAPRLALAQSASARLSLQTPDPIRVGDPVTVLLEVSHPADTVAIFPALGASWGDAVVLGIDPPETTDEGTSLQTTLPIHVALFAPGDQSLPALNVTISDRTGAIATMVAEPLGVPVVSVLTAGEGTLRPAKPQWSAPLAWLDWRLVAGAVAILVVGGGTLWAVQRRRPSRSSRAMTPLQRMLDELDAIAAANLPAQNRYKELYLAVSHVLRNHVEAEFAVDLRERTTGEMRGVLSTLPLHPDLLRRLQSLFAESDLVKFARVTPTPAGATLLLNEAREVATQVSAAGLAASPAGAAPQPGA